MLECMWESFIEKMLTASDSVGQVAVFLSVPQETSVLYLSEKLL